MLYFGSRSRFEKFKVIFSSFFVCDSTRFHHPDRIWLPKILKEWFPTPYIILSVSWCNPVDQLYNVFIMKYQYVQALLQYCFKEKISYVFFLYLKNYVYVCNYVWGKGPHNLPFVKCFGYIIVIVFFRKVNITYIFTYLLKLSALTGTIFTKKKMSRHHLCVKLSIHVCDFRGLTL